MDFKAIQLWITITKFTSTCYHLLPIPLELKFSRSRFQKRVSTGKDLNQQQKNEKQSFRNGAA